MAILAAATVEVGTLGEFFATAGTVAASQVQAHNGTWAVRANPAAATGTVSLRPPSGDMGRTTATIYSIWFRVATLPGGNTTIADVQSATAASVALIRITSGGVVTAVGATTSATVATVTTNTWWAAILTVLSNGASTLAIDGLGVAQSFSANNVTQDRLVAGPSTAATTMDLFIDDINIYDSLGTAGSGLPFRAGVTPGGFPVGRSLPAAIVGRDASQWIRR